MVALDALPDALPELVFAILAPLYELFDFFRLPKRLVEEELFWDPARCAKSEGGAHYVTVCSA
jgi:hypothetical protein